MKKYFKSFLIVWLVFFAVFNLVCFLTPAEYAGINKFGGAFWAGYIFISLAFVGQLVCAYLALREENKNKLFYKLSLLKISYTGLILTLIVGTACMAIPNLPNWIGIIICLIILAFNIAAVVSAEVASEEIVKKDEQLKAKTATIKSLISEAETLVTNAGSEDIKAECRKIYEAVRFSDPMSNDGLTEVEGAMKASLLIIEKLVSEGKADELKAAAEDFVKLVNKRNAICKGLK